MEKGKITNRQAGVLFIITAMTLLIRLPQQLAGSPSSFGAGKASWLVPIAAAIPFLIVLYGIKVLLNGNFTSLTDAYKSIFGVAATKIILSLTLVTAFFLMFHALGTVCQRQLTSVNPSTPVSLLAIILLAVIFFIARGGLVSAARSAEFIAPFLIIAVIGVLLLALPSVNIGNVYPIIPADTPKVFASSYTVFAVFGLFTLALLFSGQTSNPKKLHVIGLKGMLFLCVFAALIVFTTFGVLGQSIAGKASVPFFSVVKSISIFNTIERLDSLIMPIWLIADMISIVVYIYMAMHIMKTLFNLRETKTLATPIVILCFLSALYFYKSPYELNRFFDVITIPALLLVSVVFPLAALITGKIRKMV